MRFWHFKVEMISFIVIWVFVAVNMELQVNCGIIAFFDWPIKSDAAYVCILC